MANTLIVYATREGQTKKVAGRIADVLRSRGSAVDLVDADHPPALDPSRYDLIVVGSPVRAQGYLRSVVRFVRKHRVTLERAPSAFFSVGLAVASKTNDGRAQTNEVVERFIRKTGWRPKRVELVAGALPYSKYNSLIRFVMRRIASKAGGDTDTSRDYEYTDWRAVDAFASDLALGPVRDAGPNSRAATAGC